MAFATAVFAQSPVSAEPVEFAGEGARLAGIVVSPTSQPVIAGAVIVHGSGREPRMQELATALASRGIVALTYDKRGVGESTGRYAGPEVGTNNVDPQNLNLLAGDAAAGFRQLTNRPNLRGKAIGFIGVSQAGWIIPMAAIRTPNCRFILLWSGPVSTVKEELAFSRIAEGVPDFWKTHSADEVKATILQSAPGYTFEDTDPREPLGKLRVPGLWLFGDNDISIPVQLSIERLEGLQVGHSFEYRVIPGAGHNLPFALAFPMTIEWIHKVAASQ